MTGVFVLCGDPPNLVSLFVEPWANWIRPFTGTIEHYRYTLGTYLTLLGTKHHLLPDLRSPGLRWGGGGGGLGPDFF